MQNLSSPSTQKEFAALPKRVLLVENSRTYTSILRDAIERQLELPVAVASSLDEAGKVLEQHSDWFLVLTGLVLADAAHDVVIDYFTSRNLPTIVVSSVYDEALRQRALSKTIDFVLKSTPGSMDYLVWLVRRLDRNRRIGALVVDDSLAERSYIAAHLDMLGFEVTHVGSGEAALQHVENNPNTRLVVVDYEMPEMDGIELTHHLRQLRSRDKMAVLGVSASGNASLIPKFLKNGANDFLHKPFSQEEFFCRISQNIDQLELIGTLQDLATRDFLTGLPNRRSFLENSERLIISNMQDEVTMVMVDIDHFKRINDSFGHEAGDQALRAMSGILQQHTRAGDYSARFGGEEFCMLIRGMNRETTLQHLEHLRAAVEDMELNIGGEPLRMTISIGACSSERAHPSQHQLLGEADRQLYLAKAAGRNKVLMSQKNTSPPTI